MKISALALLKMVMHARSGGNIEVMGLMQGRVDANTMIVMDSFALPVEGKIIGLNHSKMGNPKGKLFLFSLVKACDMVIIHSSALFKNPIINF